MSGIHILIILDAHGTTGTSLAADKNLQVRRGRKMRPMLLGRNAECVRIDNLVQRAREGSSGALVVTGDAGIGKSALLRYARDNAPGVRVLAAHGVESESEIPFSGLSICLQPALHQLDSIPKPQAAALNGALALGPPTTTDPFAIYAATLSLLAAAAELGPLLVLVDDAQWLDSASAAALLFAARRIEAEGIAMLIAVRSGEGRPLDVEGLEVLTLPGLDKESCATLLHRLASVQVAAPVARELIRATRGNPLALLEVPTLLTPGQLAGDEQLAHPLRAGPSIERAFRQRITNLHADSRTALLVAAASESGAAAEILSAMEQLGLASDSLELAETAGLIFFDGPNLFFRHPLLRSGAYHGASVAARRAAHRTLAEVLGESGSPDRQAWHLAAATSGPDEKVAAALEEVGAEAARRTGHGAAARAFERAADITPDPVRRAQRLLRAADSLQLSGRPGQAITLLDRALSEAPDSALRADIQTLRARIETFRGAPMNAHFLLIEEIARIEDVDPGRAALMLADATMPCLMAAELELARRTAERAVAFGEQAGGMAGVAASTLLASVQVLLGEGTTVRPLVERTLAKLEGIPSLVPAHELVVTAALCLIWIEDYEPAREGLGALIAEARSLSAPAVLPFALAVHSELEFRTGHWAMAYADATESLRLAEETGQLNSSTYTLVNLARIEAAQGRADDCREHAGAALKIADELGVNSIRTYANAALGLLELGSGRPAEAVRYLEKVASLARSQGLAEPSTVQWAPDLIEACVLINRPDEAAATLARFEAEADATDRSWAKAAAARGRGLLAGEGFEGEFETALQLHRQLPTPFETARTELCFGRRLSAFGRTAEARTRLRSSLTAFEGLGAAPWVTLARDALTAIGERVQPRDLPPSHHLTQQELHVARLIAQGATNKEAAAALFLSPKTIEAHLGRIYRKLEIRSRTDLARLMASEAMVSEPN